MSEQVTKSDESIRQQVRDGYGQIARGEGFGAAPDEPIQGEEPASKAQSCCGPSCCGPQPVQIENLAERHAEQIGYTSADLGVAPDDANLGLGCGNPTALASLQPGEVVLDLGAGAGLDAFIAADKVGPEGRVIGVDMTPDMLARARENAVKANVADRVEFREGIIEKLPVVDSSVDVVISNCVINLSPDKPQVFREAYRVLKPGGRLAISDIVLTEPLPEDLSKLGELYVGCLAGALEEKVYLGAIRAAGFSDIHYDRVSAVSMFEGMLADPAVKQVVDALGPERVRAVAKTVFSYKIEARK